MHSTSPNIIWFKDELATELPTVGGKGANLGRLTAAGFDVPPGFVVGTAAYVSHMENLREMISNELATVNYDDAVQLDQCMEKIRDWITEAEVPASVARDIANAYEKMGSDLYVAVRSSGTSEDLEGASFAGLHDTYLDIRGTDNLIDAVKRDWASMWSARATFYRNSQGFDHFESSIAVVVQTMVESEVSGVMFTGNPLNAATDEIMINASWGLGEAVVSGIVTPDELIVRHGDLKILNKTLGSKEVSIIRNQETGLGIAEEETAGEKREAFSLSDTQIKELAALGARIQDTYGEFPQDIEWAYQGGQFYVLQARPITGVEFSWDADVTASVQGNDDILEYDVIWSRTFPEEMWTGAISPLMFSWRCWGLNQCHSVGVHAYGYPELDYTSGRLWRYHKGVSYYNCKNDLELIKLAVPPQLRPAMLEKIPEAWHEEALNAPFDWERYLNMFQKVEKERPDMGLNWWRAIRDDFINNEKYREETQPLSVEALGAMSDYDLRQYIAKVVRLEISSYDPPWNGLLWHMRESLGWTNWILENWYDGERTNLMMTLVTGTREPTITTIENHRLWKMADLIYKSPELTSLLKQYPDARFFDYVEQCINGPEFKKLHEEHMRLSGHRGHSDRDIEFDRRADNPGIDVALFKGLMGTPDPLIQEEKIREQLEETIEHVYQNLLAQENGLVKAQQFRFLIDFSHNSLLYRDNEREVMDWSTYAIKLGYEEIMRRCEERGVLSEAHDGYFLTQEELYDALDGKANMALAQAKIKARKKNFDAIDRKVVHPSKYIQAGLAANVDAVAQHGDGVFTGKTTSTGKVTGVARVVRELSQIGTVNKGEILIVHSTDPGWTPVFMLITGIVLETGGLISHGALLAREYGLPGVQIPGALELIPDGATITLDGDAGMVIIHDEDNPSLQEAAA
ncbi:MAG: PEP/pyruvate-binding domain-containing protein [Porticoccaceae bacterium]|nr:hypothetical protein [Pseudomonadales bacterium]MCP5171057.1 hypothetical protein [Pseudomonadales bacterium]MCP5301704.1 hypothetical protein [Pseudomonadales bacterium]